MTNRDARTVQRAEPELIYLDDLVEDGDQAASAPPDVRKDPGLADSDVSVFEVRTAQNPSPAEPARPSADLSLLEEDVATNDTPQPAGDSLKAEHDMVMKQEVHDFLDQERDTFAHRDSSAQSRLQSEEPAQHQSDMVRQLRKNEHLWMVQEERSRLCAVIRERLVREETHTLTEAIRTDLFAELRRQIYQSEENRIRETIRQQMVEQIRGDLYKKEYQPLFEKEMERLRHEVYSDVLNRDLKPIRAEILERIRSQEQARIERDERAAIVERERERVRTEELPKIVESVRRQVYHMELERIRMANNREICDKAAAAFREIVNTHNVAMLAERLPGLEQEIAARTQKIVRDRVKRSSEDLVAAAKTIAMTSADDEAIKSLGRLIDFLEREKKKFSGFYLSAAHTTRLYEYLKQLHDRLEQHFAGLGESVGTIDSRVKYVSQVIG